MRVGIVSLNFQYAVDLDNPDMVADAKDAITEDVTQVVFKGGSDELDSAIKITEDKSLTEADIPEFLKDLYYTGESEGLDRSSARDEFEEFETHVDSDIDASDDAEHHLEEVKQ